MHQHEFRRAAAHVQALFALSRTRFGDLGVAGAVRNVPSIVQRSRISQANDAEMKLFERSESCKERIGAHRVLPRLAQWC